MMLVFSKSHISMFLTFKTNQCFTIPSSLLTETQRYATPIIRIILDCDVYLLRDTESDHRPATRQLADPTRTPPPVAGGPQLVPLGLPISHSQHSLQLLQGPGRTLCLHPKCHLCSFIKGKACL